MKVHLIHGIHATRRSATAQLAPYLREAGLDVVVHSYGFALALPRLFGDWLNAKRAARLAQRIHSGDAIVAHSNGCTIAYLIQRDHKRLSRLVLLQPALDNDVSFTGTDRALVIYNAGDDVVEWSALARFSKWGNMGRVGYKGSSENVEQWDSLDPPGDLPSYSGHCGFVENGKALLRQWAAAIGAWLRKER